MAKRPRPTLERVKELLHYDPETGIFTRRVPQRSWRGDKRKYGKVGAGRISPFGYVMLMVNNINYNAALLAWLYVYGEWPKGAIKYLNGQRTDNRISNLFVQEKSKEEIAAEKLTLERLKELLHYEPGTGHFTWRVTNAVASIGARGGGEHGLGYRTIGVDYKKFLEHILAWFYMTGEWPDKEVDHINRNRSDNRWENLRLATRSQNGHNKELHPRNTTGFRGVYRYGTIGFLARIDVQRKTIHLGTFKTAEEAYAARLAAEERYGIAPRN